MLENTGNLMVLLAMASVIVSTAVKVQWLTPILHAAAVFPFFYNAMKDHHNRWALVLVVRWALAIFFTTLILGVFVPSRMDASIPYSEKTVATLQNWISGSGAPPVDFRHILWGLAAFPLGTFVSGGLVGFIIAAVAIGTASSGALFLFEHGLNVLPITLVALPVWQWGAFASCAVLMVPAARPFFDRFFRTERAADDKTLLLNYMYIGAACFLASIVLRLTLAGVTRDLLARWTIL